MEFAFNLLKFEDVRQGIIEYLKKNGNYSADFDFDAANIRYYIDAMAYATMLMSYNQSQLSNNLFLDTTEIRKNAVSVAKRMGYRPRRKVASQFNCKILYKGEGFNQDSKIILNKYNNFTGEKTNLNFINISPITLSYKNETTLEGELFVYQGKMIEYRYNGNGEPLQSFTIIDEDVEDNYFMLYVKKNYQLDSEKKLWTKVDTFFALPSDDIYFIEEDIVNEYCPKVIFGNGTIGRIVLSDEQVIVNYMQTKGDDGNGETKILLPSILDLSASFGIDIIEMNNFELVFYENTESFGGLNNESLDEIKQNASKYYFSVGRAITSNDYENVLTSYSYIYAFSVKGGDEIYVNNESEKGNVYISAMPYISVDNFQQNDKLFLTNSEELNVYEYLNNISVLSLDHKFIKPTYLYINVQPYVEVSMSLTDVEVNDVVDNTYKNLIAYRDKTFNDLGVDYRESQLVTEINNTTNTYSGNITSDYYFIIAKDNFYDTRENKFFLPTVHKKDSNGNIIFNDNYIPLTTNFIKKCTTVIDEQAELGNNYTVENLPIELSTIKGTLYHKNINRTMYNRDYLELDLFEIYEDLNNVVTFNCIPFYSKDGKLYEFFIKEEGIPNQWNLYLDSTQIGTLIRDNSQSPKFYINTLPSAEQYLKDIGFTDTNIEVVDMNGYYVARNRITSIFCSLKLYGKKDIMTCHYDSTNHILVVDESIKLYDQDGNEYQMVVTKIDDLTFNITLNNPTLDILFVVHYDDVNDVLSIDTFNKTWLNKFGYRKDLEMQDDANDPNKKHIIATDIFHDSYVGRVNYENGELLWYQRIWGYNEYNATVKDRTSITITKFFDNYDDNVKMDKIQMIPAYTTQGGEKFLLKDFNSNFNQFVVLYINTPIVKRI